MSAKGLLPSWLGRRDAKPKYEGFCRLNPFNGYFWVFPFRRIRSFDSGFYEIWGDYSCRDAVDSESRFRYHKRGQMLVVSSFMDEIPDGETEDRTSKFYCEWDSAIKSVYGDQRDTSVSFDSWREYAGASPWSPNKYIKVYRDICKSYYDPLTSRYTVKKLEWSRRQRGDARIVLSELLDLGIVAVKRVFNSAGGHSYGEYMDVIYPNTDTDLLTAIEVLSWFREATP